MKKFSLYILLAIGLVATELSCKKFVDLPSPSNQIVDYQVFKDDGSAQKAVSGLYIQMIGSSNIFSAGNITYYAGMCSDELYYYVNDQKREFVQNEISSTNHDLISILLWNPAYKFIYTANACVNGLQASSTLTPTVKNRLIGEAKFIRAYCYFYLVNIFGDVPLVITTDYERTAVMSRTPKADVYELMVRDLENAKELLEPSSPYSQSVRPNKWAAAALLARIYLYRKEWDKAILESSEIISSNIYHLEPDLNMVFKKDSHETIFQIASVQANINTWEGSVFLPPSNLATPTYLITNSLFDAFEPGDLRKLEWIQSRQYRDRTYYFPSKYRVQTSMTVTEHYIYLRLAEQYLIRAEARANKGDIIGAQSDLNAIRNRAGLPNTTANNESEMKFALEQERQVELFAEWGHRWFDLIRTQRANVILGNLKPDTWQQNDTLWPIPSGQIKLNPNLVQNPGY